MKAVFLDRNTLSERIDVDIPKGVNQWVAFQKTAPDETYPPNCYRYG